MDSKLEVRFQEMLQCSVSDNLISKKNLVYGNPDFFYLKRKIAFFIDGDLFHNKKVILAKRIKTPSFKKRLLAGVRRDSLVKKTLEKDGWTVVRISESEIKDHPEYCTNLIKKTLIRNEN